MANMAPKSVVEVESANSLMAKETGNFAGLLR
jgi:hypothetical protein